MFSQGYRRERTIIEGGAIDNGARFVDMERTRLAGGIEPGPVVEAKGGIGSFLHLIHEGTLKDGMYGSGGDEEHVAGFDRDRGERVGKRGGFNGRPQLFNGQISVESEDTPRTLLCRNDVPALGFAEFSPSIRARLRVVRMHLYGEPLRSVDEFTEQGEGPRCRDIAEKFQGGFGRKARKRIANKGTGSNR